MAKLNLSTLGKVVKGVVVIAVVISAVYVPFFLVVWKEKQLKTLSLEQEILNGELLQLQSKTAGLQISIEQLSTGERLERYALDSLGMVQPDPMKIVAVERRKDGTVIVDDNGMKGFLFKLMGQ